MSEPQPNYNMYHNDDTNDIYSLPHSYVIFSQLTWLAYNPAGDWPFQPQFSYHLYHLSNLICLFGTEGDPVVFDLGGFQDNFIISEVKLTPVKKKYYVVISVNHIARIALWVLGFLLPHIMHLVWLIPTVYMSIPDFVLLDWKILAADLFPEQNFLV